MADFNPGAATIQVANEVSPGLKPLAAAFVDHEFISEGFSNERTTKERESITNAAQTPAPLPGKFNTDGPLSLEMNAEQHYHYIGNIQRKITTTTPATDVYNHRMGPTEDDPFPDSLSVQVNRDDGMPQTFVEGRVNELTLSLEEGGVLKADAGLIFQRGHYWDDAAELEDGATPNSAPVLRGLPSYANWTAADGDVYVKVTAGPSGGAFTVKAKVGAAATYGATTTSVVYGLDADGNVRWNNLLDSNGGGQIGTRALPVQIAHILSTGIEVNDEWRFDRERSAWVPAYADVPIFNEVHAYLYVDGVEHCIESFELAITRPVTAQKCIGGFFARRILLRGKRVVTLTLGRQYTDIFFRKKLESAESLYFFLEASTGEEFETGYEHQLEVFCPNVVLNGRTASVESSEDFVEQITGTCHPSSAGVSGYFDDVTITIVNSVPDLTA